MRDILRYYAGAAADTVADRFFDSFLSVAERARVHPRGYVCWYYATTRGILHSVSLDDEPRRTRRGYRQAGRRELHWTATLSGPCLRQR